MEENNEIQVIKFGFSVIPKPVESNPTDDNVYVTHGNDNKYPQFLLGLYGKSPLFASIINQKSSFINGGGLVYTETQKPLIGKPNANDTWELFTEKIIKSYLLFNAYAVEVNFDAYGEPCLWNFISYEQIRYNKSITKVWVNQDWSKKNNAIAMPRYFPEKDYEGDESTSSKVFIYNGYVPSPNSGVYTLPEYFSLIQKLSIDTEISDFEHSNITNAFSVSTLINVYQNGTPESKAAFQKSITESYTGAKGQNFIISFNNQSSNSKETTITPLSDGNWISKYESIKASNTEAIFLGMGIVNPSIFGKSQPGALGNTQELANSFKLLDKFVISTKRNQLEASLREMLNIDVSFLDVVLFRPELSDAMKQAVMSIDEIRAEAGLPPLADGSGSSLIAKAPASTFTLSPTNNQFSVPEKPKWEKVEPTDEHFDKIKHLGTDKSQFKLYEGNFAQAKLQFSDESDINQFLIDQEISNMTLAQLKAVIREKLGINISISELQDRIDDVVATGVIAVDKSGDNITITKGEKLLDPVEKRVVETYYEYQKRPDADGTSIIGTTRPFCRKIIEMNKYFSLEEIQSISRTLNYDVFLHCGGFWRLGGTTGEGNADNTRPHCRHQWKQVSVVRKPNDNL